MSSKKKVTKNIAEAMTVAESPSIEEQKTEPETVTVNSALKLQIQEEANAKIREVSETRYGEIQNARFVNVRDNPSPTSNVVKVAKEGERVIILYEESGYYKVEFIDEVIGFVATEFIKEIHGGDIPDNWFVEGESILTSVKKLLGLDESCEEFDLDLMITINGAISSLRQMGVGPLSGFLVTNKNATYSDYLGEGSLLIPNVKLYLYYKCRLSFDTPTSSAVTEVLKECLREVEWRLRIEGDNPELFKDKEVEP